MAFGFGLGFPRRLGAGGGFSPASLFLGGITGVWYDPSDFTTLFQDAAGTTPVTAVEQPVGLMLDKSQGLVLGSELFSSFTSTGTWTVVGGGSYSITSAAAQSDLSVTYAGTTGKRYVISFTLSGVAGTVFCYPLNSSPTSNLSNGVITLRQESNSGVFIIRAATGASATVSNISVRELPGNHAFQSTNTGYRPTLKARYNQLTYTEQFDNAAWTKRSSTATAGVITASAGGPADHSVTQSVSGLTGTLITSIDFKAGTSNFAWVCSSVIYGLGNYATAVVDLSTGAVSKTQAGGTVTIVSASISAADAEGYRRLTFTVSSSGSGMTTVVGISNSATPTISSYGSVDFTAAGTETINARKVQLVTLADNDLIDGEYQRVAAATDYNTDPALFPVYLDFDGSNDFMVSNSINFTSTDKVTVWAGVGKDTDAGVSIPFELSVNHVANAGSFAVYASASALPNYEFRLTGTSNVYQTATSYTAPCYNILSCLFDINGADTASEIYPQVDGTVPFLTAGGAANAGTGNFGTYPLYLGSRGGSAFFFNGKLFGLIVRGAASTSTEIYQGELWMAGKEDLTLYPDAAFNPLSLFAGGAPGAWYKPSDFYNYMSQLGPELVTNGDFSNGTTGWTVGTNLSVAVVSGQAQVTRSGPITASNAFQTIATVTSGKPYIVSIDVITDNGAARGISSSTNLFFPNAGPANFLLGAGTYKFFIIATDSQIKINLWTNDGTTSTFDNVSVREFTGTFSMYQEATGVTPVTAVEQSVGLILDQSKGGLGPELVTNGGFSSSSNWTLSNTTITGGNLVFGVASGYASQAISGTAGNYKLLVNKSVGFAGVGNLTFAFYNAGSIVGSAIPIGSATLTAGSGIVTASGSFDEIRMTCGTTDAYQVDSVSLARAPGNHAFQSTPANCPILRARYNLLTYSEDFSNAIWTKTTGVSASGSNLIYNGLDVAGWKLYQAAASSVGVRKLTCIVSGNGSFDLYSNFGDRLSIVATSTPTTYELTLSLLGANSGNVGIWSSTNTAFNLNLKIDLRLANTPSSIPYQRIAAATDYATGSAFPVYLAFDGSNDSLATNSIDFTGTNKMFVCASVTKIGANGMISELSTNASGNAGAFHLYWATTNYQMISGGTISNTILPLAAAAPSSDVVSGVFNISAPVMYGRVNGDTKASSALTQGTGNYGNYPLYIGSRASASFFFNMYLFDLLVCGALVDYTDVANTEYYMAGEAGLPRTLTYDYVTLDDGDQITTDSGDPIYDQITFT